MTRTVACPDGTTREMQVIRVNSTRQFLPPGSDPSTDYLRIDNSLYWLAEIVSETELGVVYVGEMER